MNNIFDSSGDDLLKVFEELEIQLLHLDPNVIKAWFDTDDTNMKHLLNWICVSLSKANYISPSEVAEYDAIQSPLTNEELEIEKDVIESKYPDIFDIEYNLLEIEFLEEDLILARQQERELDHGINYNRNLEEKLINNLTQKVKEEIESSVKLKTMQEKCVRESEKLDKLNEDIHDHLVKCTKVLHSFEFSPSPYFISNFQVDPFKEKVDNLLSLLKPVIEKSSGVENSTALTSVSSLNMPMDDTITTNLNNMHDRILHSQHRYLATTMEIEKLNAIISYLNKTCIESLIKCDDASLTQSIAVKLDTKERLYDMLENSTKKYAERHISRHQSIYIEQQVKTHRKSLIELSELEEKIRKMLAHYFVLRTMYDEERKEIENYENMFKAALNYINRDMESCSFRIERMKDVIQSYQASSSQEKLKLSKTIVKLLNDNETNYSIDRAFELLSDFNKEVDFLKTKLFTPGFGNLKSQGADLRNSIKTLQSFLVSGPTHRVLLLPSDVQILIRRVEDILKKELESVKSSMQIISSAKKVPSKWKNYRRQLWMYFYADPDQLKFILKDIQEEVTRSKVKK